MNVFEAGQALFDYLSMKVEAPRVADCVIVLGSNDLNVPRYAGELCAAFHYPVVVFSGKHGRNTDKLYERTEAEAFAAIAEPYMPPDTVVLLELTSTNTAENISFSIRLLAENGFRCCDYLLVQNPTMTRRAYATFKALFPQLSVSCVCPPIPFSEYLKSESEARRFINSLVGNLQRIFVYPSKGFQIAQDVPPHVKSAYQYLIAQGYDEQLVADEP